MGTNYSAGLRFVCIYEEEKNHEWSLQELKYILKPNAVVGCPNILKKTAGVFGVM